MGNKSLIFTVPSLTLGGRKLIEIKLLNSNNNMVVQKPYFTKTAGGLS